MKLASGCIGALWLTLLTESARAHVLEIETFALPGGRIRIEVFYPQDARPARGAEVVVRDDSSGAEVARGITDGQGAFEFSAPAGAVLKVEALHEGGHRAVATIRPSTLPAGPPTTPRRGVTPWAGLGAGLLVIALLAVGALWFVRSRRSPRAS